MVAVGNLSRTATRAAVLRGKPEPPWGNPIASGSPASAGRAFREGFALRRFGPIAAGGVLLCQIALINIDTGYTHETLFSRWRYLV